MKKSMLIFTSILIVFCYSLPAFAAFKSEYKMNCNLAENTAWGQGAAYFAKLVRERTDGKVNIRPYYSAQLTSGKQSNELLMLRNGTIDFSLAGPSNWATQLPQMTLFTLPWLLASQPDVFGAMEAIVNGKSGRMLEEVIASAGVRVIGWSYSTPRELHTGKPVRRPEDIKGMKIRFVASPLVKDIFDALGASPVNINWSEALTAFQQGLVDGGENPYNTMIPYRIYDFSCGKYITEWHYTCAAMFFVANANIWNSFDKDTQMIVKECADKAGIFQAMLGRMGIDDGTAIKWLTENNLLPPDSPMMPHDPYKLLKKHGVTIIRLTPEEQQAFRAATRGVMEKWTKVVGEDIVKAVHEDFAAYFSKNKK